MVQLGDGVTGNLQRTSLANKQNGMHSFKPDLFFFKSLVVYFMENNNFPPENWLSILSLKQSVSWATWKKNVLRNSSKTSYYYNSWRKKKKKWQPLSMTRLFYLKRVNLNNVLISPSPSKQCWAIGIHYAAYYKSNVTISSRYEEGSI